MTVDGPYDYARERWEAVNAEPYGTRRIGQTDHHENDVPAEDEA